MKTKRFIRTRGQAKAFVLEVGLCGIFSEDNGQMPCLWNVVDLPERQVGEGGWGQRVMAIWRWKDELPALFPEMIFYGKNANGLAVLMTLDHLRHTHYSSHHRAVQDCTSLAQKIHAIIALEPMTTTALRKELQVTKGKGKTQFDKALLELQVTLNIARRNSLEDKKDTWVLFGEQYSIAAMTSGREAE